MNSILEKELKFYQIEKLIQELAWRDYWQQVWVSKGEEINEDLRSTQTSVTNHKMPTSLIDANTGIKAIDEAIVDFYETGYLHNHLRMYIASVACNIGKSHWKAPAQWMYYHLLDGDWASNALSWQWVAGSNSSKKYVANQENINKYTGIQQTGGFLDVSYARLESMPVPEELQGVSFPRLITELPKNEQIVLNPNLPTLIYNSYNLDPEWHRDIQANRILLLEPAIFKKYPVSPRTISFIMGQSSRIPGIQTFAGDFDDLIKKYQPGKIIYKEHPLNTHYSGTKEPREWMFDVKGYYPSFSSFWKQCMKKMDQ